MQNCISVFSMIFSALMTACYVCDFLEVFKTIYWTLLKIFTILQIYLLRPILFRTCRYFTGLCSSNIPRYFLDFTLQCHKNFQCYVKIVQRCLLHLEVTGIYKQYYGSFDNTLNADWCVPYSMVITSMILWYFEKKKKNLFLCIIQRLSLFSYCKSQALTLNTLYLHRLSIFSKNCTENGECVMTAWNQSLCKSAQRHLYRSASAYEVVDING